MIPTLLLLPLLLAQAAPAAPADASAIRADDLRAHVTFLASDELEGRESGKKGGHLAARYVAAHFARLGLAKLDGQEDYRIPFEVGELTCYNVVAVIPGTDPELAKRYVAIGGHHDHAGIGGPGAMGFPDQIHNGADDNASGTAGVLELAEYFAANPLKHSILVMTFSAEERGLLGSEHLVKSRTLPVDDIVYMLNCDMIGRSNGYLFVGGLGTAEEFRPMLEPLFEASTMELELDDRGEAPSDNTSFFHAGIPALFFFTNIHDDYHRPGDDADKIDYNGQAQIVELVAAIAERMDDATSLSFVEFKGMGMPADFMAKMMDHYRKAEEYKAENRGRLGIRGSEERDGGVVVSEVTAGSAAAEAGVLAGDVVLEVGGSRTSDLRALRRALGGKRRGMEVELKVRRDGAELSLSAILH